MNVRLLSLICHFITLFITLFRQGNKYLQKWTADLLIAREKKKLNINLNAELSSSVMWDVLLQLDALQSIGPDGFIPGYSKSFLKYFSTVLGVWRGPSKPEVGKHSPSFQERREKRSC